MKKHGPPPWGMKSVGQITFLSFDVAPAVRRYPQDGADRIEPPSAISVDRLCEKVEDRRPEGQTMRDWDDLRTFLAISRHGNLSAAARSLGVTQTTMGRRLQSLHDRSGARLLDRTPTGFVLTSAGERILPSVERMEADALSIERAITGEDVRLEGEVRITSVELIAAAFILPSLGALAKRYPGITVEVDVETRSLSLSRREADIAIRMAPFEQHEAVVRRAAELSFGLYAAQGYLDQHGAPDWAGGAPGHRLVTLQQTLLHAPEAKRLAAIASAASVAVRTNSREGQLRSVLAGLGIACLPRFVGDGKGLVLLTAPGDEPRRQIWIGVHQDTRHTPRIRVVLDHLHAVFASEANRLSPRDAPAETHSRSATSANGDAP